MVDMAGPDQPPDLYQLTTDLLEVAGESVPVQVIWSPQQQLTTPG